MTTRRAALVTGCSTGIGRATALHLHEAGFVVYATARRVETLDELASRGLKVLALDVTDDESMQTAVDTVVKEHGAVSVLVNNAGYGLQGTVEETSIDEVRRQFETNVYGLVRLTQLCLPGMRDQRWGRVVNIGSMGGRFTLPGGGFYHASKHAVEAVSDAMRLELAPFGVSVSLVQPGPVRSAFGETAVGTIDEDESGPYAEFHRDLAAQYAHSYRSGRSSGAITPDDVAKVVVKAAGSRPRPRYAVGAVARALITTRRLVPDQLWDALIRSMWVVPKASSRG